MPQSTGGAIYAHDAQTGKLLWSKGGSSFRFRDGPVTYEEGSALWLASRKTYDTGYLFNLDLNNGEIIKSFPTGMLNTGTSAPTILQDKVIVAGSHPGIAMFDKDTGVRKWLYEVQPSLFYTPSYFSDNQQSIEVTPVIIHDKVVFGAMDGFLYVLDITFR